MEVVGSFLSLLICSCKMLDRQHPSFGNEGLRADHQNVKARRERGERESGERDSCADDRVYFGRLVSIIGQEGNRSTVNWG